MNTYLKYYYLPARWGGRRECVCPCEGSVCVCACGRAFCTCIDGPPGLNAWSKKPSHSDLPTAAPNTNTIDWLLVFYFAAPMGFPRCPSPVPSFVFFPVWCALRKPSHSRTRCGAYRPWPARLSFRLRPLSIDMGARWALLRDRFAEEMQLHDACSPSWPASHSQAPWSSLGGGHIRIV